MTLPNESRSQWYNRSCTARVRTQPRVQRRAKRPWQHHTTCVRHSHTCTQLRGLSWRTACAAASSVDVVRRQNRTQPLIMMRSDPRQHACRTVPNMRTCLYSIRTRSVRVSNACNECMVMTCTRGGLTSFVYACMPTDLSSAFEFLRPQQHHSTHVIADAATHY